MTAAFSHGFAIRAFLSGLLAIPSHEIIKMPYCDNTAVSLLHYESGGLDIAYHSDNSHLQREDSTFAHQTWWRAEKEWVSENLRFEPYDEERDKGLLEMLRTESGAVKNESKEYTAFLTDEPVGLVGYSEPDGAEGSSNAARDGDGEAGWIGHIFIRPDFRGGNFGTQLLGQALSYFRKLGMERLRVKVQPGSPAHGFCLKHGFLDTGPEGELCIMEKNIRNW
jgi:probable phosphoglycerate mutase